MRKKEHIFGNILYVSKSHPNTRYYYCFFCQSKSSVCIRPCICRALKVGYLGLEFPDEGAWPWISEWATGVSKELILSSALRLSF